MKDETQTWLKYANENLRSAKLLLESNLFNPCLQNIQQAVEKWLKALIVESSLKRVHPRFLTISFDLSEIWHRFAPYRFACRVP